LNLKVYYPGMSSDEFLEKIKEDNQDYKGKMKSLTFIVLRGKEQKKIFKWFFTLDNIDFFITFPYFKSKEYYCGIIEIPKNPKTDEVFDAVKNGTASTEPVKFSYHKDGNIHFKQSNFSADAKNKGEKLAKLKASPITDLNGGHLFTIWFEGLSKFTNLTKRKSRNGDQEVVLRVPEDIINFEVQAYAGPTQKSIDGQVKKDAVPWFQLTGRSTEGQPVFVEVYAILSRRSHIVDQNKNGLHVLVGFDHSKLKETGKVKSLYLFAR